MRGIGSEESGSGCKRGIGGHGTCMQDNRRWEFKLVDEASGEEWAVTRWSRDGRKFSKIEKVSINRCKKSDCGH